MSVSQSVEALRSLLRDYFGRSGNSRDLSSAGTGATGVSSPSSVAIELEKVTRGRLEWLIQRLRADFAMELASALREADPLGPSGGGWTSSASSSGGVAGLGAASGAAAILGERGQERGGEVDDETKERAVARVKVREDTLRGELARTGGKCVYGLCPGRICFAFHQNLLALSGMDTFAYEYRSVKILIARVDASPSIMRHSQRLSGIVEFVSAASGRELSLGALGSPRLPTTSSRNKYTTTAGQKRDSIPP